MANDTLRDRGTSPPALLLKGRLVPALPVLLWITLAVAALWRTVLAWQVMTAQGQSSGMLALGQAAVVIRWRQLDVFFGWGVFILWLTSTFGAMAGTLRQWRQTTLFATLTAIGVLLSALSIAWDAWNPGRDAPFAFVGERLGLIAAIGLGLVGLAAVLMELRAVSRDMPGGQIHLLHLWRVLTAQWVLAWVAATVALQVFQRREDLLGTESARQLLFNIPALGLLPNLLMLSGIRLWNVLVRPDPGAAPLSPTQQPRFRAWILAMVLATLGGILVIVRLPWMGNSVHWLGIWGGILLLASIVFYALGFPPAAWRTARTSKPQFGGRWGGLLHAVAWFFFASAITLVVWERIGLLSTAASGMAYLGNSWRHLLFLAFCLWLLHTFLVGQSLLVAPRYRLGGERLIALTAGLLIAGGGWMSLLLLRTWSLLGEAQVPVLRMLFWGALPEAIAVLAMAGLLWRVLRNRQNSQ